MKVRTTVYAGTYKKIRTGSGGGPAEVIILIKGHIIQKPPDILKKSLLRTAAAVMFLIK